MAKKEILENNENQLTKEEKYQLAKECFEKEDYEHAFRMGISAGSASAFSELLATEAEIRQVYASIEA